jgi:hypothetical protein
MTNVKTNQDRFHLGDDGTLDTVIVCNGCGAELRFNYNYDTCDTEDDTRTDDQRYDDFVMWCIDDAAETHECESEVL